jgi:hypothetical protein
MNVIGEGGCHGAGRAGQILSIGKINSTTERREGSWVEELKVNTVGRWRHTVRSEYPM